MTSAWLSFTAIPDLRRAIVTSGVMGRKGLGGSPWPISLTKGLESLLRASDIAGRRPSGQRTPSFSLCKPSVSARSGLGLRLFPQRLLLTKFAISRLQPWNLLDSHAT
jgi:hypothetical protein